MQTKKPVPPTVQDSKPPRLCPVCGKATYSHGGIHPQCAQTRADAPRVEILKASKKAEKEKHQADLLLPSVEAHKEEDES